MNIEREPVKKDRRTLLLAGISLVVGGAGLGMAAKNKQDIGRLDSSISYMKDSIEVQELMACVNRNSVRTMEGRKTLSLTECEREKLIYARDLKARTIMKK